MENIINSVKNISTKNITNLQQTQQQDWAKIRRDNIDTRPKKRRLSNQYVVDRKMFQDPMKTYEGAVEEADTHKTHEDQHDAENCSNQPTT